MGPRWQEKRGPERDPASGSDRRTNAPGQVFELIVADDDAVTDAQAVLFQLCHLCPTAVVEPETELVAFLLPLIALLNLMPDHATGNGAGRDRGCVVVLGVDLAAGRAADDGADNGTRADVHVLVPELHAIDGLDIAAGLTAAAYIVAIAGLGAAGGQNRSQCKQSGRQDDSSHGNLLFSEFVRIVAKIPTGVAGVGAAPNKAPEIRCASGVRKATRRRAVGSRR